MLDVTNSPSLNGLPEGIVLAIVEAGVLGVKDALALRWTSQNLYAISELRLFWMLVAANVEKTTGNYLHLTLPLFCPGFNGVPTEELKAACISHHRRLRNLASSTPKLSNHRILELSRPEGLFGIEVLPGGQHALVIPYSPEIQIRDIGRSHGASVENGVRVGTKLASFPVPGRIETYEYQLRTSVGRNEVQIASLTRMHSHATTVTCIVVCFRFANEADVSAESLLKIDLTMQSFIPKIIQRESLIAKGSPP